MSTITMKSTKQEMYDAYMAMKEKVDAKVALKDDPVAQKEAARQQEVLVSAGSIAHMNILAPEIVDKYTALCEAVELKEKSLKEMYDIEKEANSMIALINAHKDKKVELEEKYKAMTEDMQEEFNDKKATLAAELEEMKKQKEAVLKATIEENNALIADIKKQRERNEEEYKYDLRRSRKVENDAWNDEKATREKEIAMKEAELAEAEAKLEVREAKIAELEEKVAGIPELIAQATEDGKKAGKADADKSHVFEVRSINTKNEYEQKSLQDRVDRLTAELAAANVKVDTLQEKLDAAYAQMRELASETVKSANGVKIIDRENTGK